MKLRIGKSKIKWVAVVLVLSLLGVHFYLNNPAGSLAEGADGDNAGGAGQQSTETETVTPAETSDSAASSSAESGALVYNNEGYGFSFSLPSDWKGYTIIESVWEGLTTDASGEKTAATGPIISIRDPRWTSETPRQDIPIMVFTLAQWDSLQNDEFHIGAAPIGPTELGRNNKYVFALPARYNFAFPEGYEEVETILKGSPLKTCEVS